MMPVRQDAETEAGLPIYEYRCRKCGAVSEYLEKQGEWHLLPRRCRHCGRRKTKRIVSSFSASVARSTAETLNELKQMGNVNFVPRQAPPSGEAPPPGGCPYENREKEPKEALPNKASPIEVKPG